MNRFIRVSLAVLALFIACAMPGQAANSHGGHGGGRGGAVGHFHGGGGRGGSFGHFHGGGRWWGPGWGAVWGLGLWDLTYPYYGYPYYGYYDYPYYTYYGQTPAVVQQPYDDTYAQPSRQPVATGYWYYCPNPQGYYPYVKRCPTGWMKVVPSPPPPE